MVCYHPQRAYRSREFNKATGKYGLTFSAPRALNPEVFFKLPCGSCIGCRRDRQQEWATRLMHEAKMHERSSFLRLSYAPKHLPDDLSVSKRHMQLFMHRLRKYYVREYGVKGLRFFGIGEYGEQKQRPHYHALIFGADFREDRKVLTFSSDLPVYKSPALDREWSHGDCTVGTVTMASAMYCASYVLKQRDGEVAEKYYQRTVHPDTGEAVSDPQTGGPLMVAPEFALMSRRPGIGATWLAKYKADAFPSDFIIVDGEKRPVPAAYLRRLPEAEQEVIKAARRLKAGTPEAKANSTPERLAVREFIATDRAKRGRAKKGGAVGIASTPLPGSHQGMARPMTLAEIQAMPAPPVPTAKEGV